MTEMKTPVLYFLAFTYTICNIHVFAPASLRNTFPGGKISNTIADFGIVPYGHSISGQVILAKPFDGCDPLKISQTTLKAVQGNMIVLVERGRCNFSQKVINAQNIGASAVLISDNDSSKDVHKIFAVERVKSMLDKVKIPSLLLNKVDSDIIKKRISRGEQVELGIDFELRKAKTKSKLSFILSVDDYRCYDSLLSLQPYFQSFKDSMDVSVHYKVFRNVKVAKSTECLRTQGNKFCLAKSFGNNLQSQNLMHETLRQMCIYKHYKSSFFDYLKSVRKFCFNQLDQNIKDGFERCTTAIFAHYFGMLNPQQLLDSGTNKHIISAGDSLEQNATWPGVDKIPKLKISEEDRVKVLQCSQINGVQSSEMFEQNNDDIRYYLINYSPLVFINGVYYKGNFDDTTHLLESFCSSFEIEPIQCETLESFKILKAADTSVFFDYLLRQLFITVIFLVFIGIGFYIFYKKRVRGHMDYELHRKINQAISNFYNVDPVDIDKIHLTKAEKNNLDILVEKIDKVAASSHKGSKSHLSAPTTDANALDGNRADTKSLVNLKGRKDTMESNDDSGPNKTTFS